MLIVLDYVPYPVWGGGRQRSFLVSKSFTSLADVAVAIPAPTDTHKRRLQELASVLGVDTYDLSSAPLEEAVVAFKPSLVHFETIYAAFDGYSRIGNCPFTVDCHNIEWLRDKALAERGWTGFSTWKNTQVKEYLVWCKSRGLLVCSREEQRLIARATRAPVCYAPHAVPVPDIPAEVVARRVENWSRRKPTFLYTAHLGYEPNIDAIQWLAAEIWPRLRLRYPESKLIVAGTSPSPAIHNYCNDAGIVLRTDIDDMTPIFLEGDLYLIPLRVGAGVSIKGLEAAAYGLPVITTSVGCRDLIELQEVFQIANTVDGLIDAVEVVLQEPKALLKQTGIAREIVGTYYSYDVMVERIRSFINQLI